MRETLSTLTDLVRAGKVRYIGCSNFPAWLHCKALWISDKYNLESYTVSQPRYNLFQRDIEREIIPMCIDQGIGIVPYSPLAGGVLTGKYKAGSPPPPESRGATQLEWIKGHGFSWEDPENLKILKGLEALSKDIGMSIVQIALAWFRANSAITAPIIAASNMKQLDEILSVTNINLRQVDLERINNVASLKGPYFT
jgi:aryl-alcohol dehydrogenase-like predicted oxidoreductase